MALTGEVVAGGDAADFCVVRHVQLRGDHRSIGRDIADLAWTNHQVRPQPSPDPALTCARRKWRELHWPQLEARAQGVADYWQMPYDDHHEFGTLPIGFPNTGCSVVWLPSDRTTSEASMLSRNFDFVTLSLNQMIGAPPADGDEPFCGRPYVLETYPTTGHATLTITAFDLLSAAVDGINDAGVVVALLSDDESTTGAATAAGLEPTFAPAVGISEVDFCRYVLEQCANIDEALEAVRVARHYYFLHPQHFLVADRSGRSFVYEYSAAHNAEHVTWGDGLQVVTNHLLCRYPTIEDLPAGDGDGWTFKRFRTLTSLFSDQPRYSRDEIAERHASIRFTGRDLPVRTLWSAQYDTDANAMTVSFHLRDVDDGEIRTPDLRFALDTTALGAYGSRSAVPSATTVSTGEHA